MTVNSYAGLKAAIITKLATLQGSGSADLFAAVYGVNETDPAGYPIAYVIEKTGDGQILDTHRNEREWQFSVAIHVAINEGRSPEEAYDALLDAADRVIESFDQDPMLKDGNGEAQCLRCRVVPVEFEYGSQETSVHRALLTVACVNNVNRYVSA